MFGKQINYFFIFEKMSSRAGFGLRVIVWRSLHYVSLPSLFCNDCS